ncbi:hypothetical protein BDN72DRAFT_595299 [Pluteus cervinus]|uniref:Uncharacterized protein n=1 Tax=Pluteus cervinus TaxID=181527 RepID=A0ACD3AUH2_9AGAR|nr:hypothetical protein BDN72DRAFT_595299 [Pluteus cervinus]
MAGDLLKPPSKPRSSPFSAVFGGVFRFLLQNLTLRFTLLRLICISSFIAIILELISDEIQDTLEDGGLSYYEPKDRFRLILALFLVPVLFLHHTPSAFGPHFCLPNVIDFVLLMAEIAAGWFIIPSPWYDIPANLQNEVSFLAFSWVLIITLTVYGVVRLVVVVSLGWRGLLKRLDLSEVDWTGESGRIDHAVPRTPTTATQKARSVLCGRAIWRARLP